MAPTVTEYVQGLRRFWWLPLLALLLGVGASLVAAGRSAPTTATTTGHVLFTFRVEDAGDEAAGSARSAEAAVAESRLQAYVRLAAASQQVRSLLAANGISSPPVVLAEGTPGAGRVTMASTGAGVVEVKVKNDALSKPEASLLVESLSHEVARSALATDSLQAAPSLLPDPAVTAPQALDTVPRPRGMRPLVPILVLFTLGLAAIYVVVWRQGRINARADIEQRVGARVLGEVTGRSSDGAALALALIKRRDSGTRVLLATVGDRPEAAARLGELVVSAGSGLGLHVTLTSTSEAVKQPVGVRTPSPRQGASEDLSVAFASNGLDPNALRAAVSVDIVGLIVQYRTTSYRDLNATARTLAEVTDAEIAVIGVHS